MNREQRIEALAAYQHKQASGVEWERVPEWSKDSWRKSAEGEIDFLESTLGGCWKAEGQTDEHGEWLQLEIESIFEEMESPCPHVHLVMPNRPKRACDLCYVEIRKQAGFVKVEGK